MFLQTIVCSTQSNKNNYLLVFTGHLSVKSSLNVQLDFTATAGNQQRNDFQTNSDALDVHEPIN